MKTVSQLVNPRTDQGENRHTPRRKVILKGCLVFGTEHFTLDCLIRNLTSDGAQVEVPNPHFVPNDITLLVPKTLLAYDAHVKWRKDRRLGLSFHKLIPLDREAIGRTRILWTLLIEMQGRSSEAQ